MWEGTLFILFVLFSVLILSEIISFKMSRRKYWWNLCLESVCTLGLKGLISGLIRLLKICLIFDLKSLINLDCFATDHLTACWNTILAQNMTYPSRRYSSSAFMWIKRAIHMLTLLCWYKVHGYDPAIFLNHDLVNNLIQILIVMNFFII